jgi:hypothetical protein
VLIGKDEKVLSRRSKKMLEFGKGVFFIVCIVIFQIHDHLILETIFAPALRHSWLVLIRQTCLLLLQSITDSPQYVVLTIFTILFIDPQTP